MSSILDPSPKEPTLEQHMIEFGKVTAASINSAIDPEKKYLILQGNKVAQVFIKNAFEFFEKHFPNKNPHILTARCLQVNISAVRRFKKGPTEKSICQKPYTKKSRADDNTQKSKEPKCKKAEASKNKKKETIPKDSVFSNKSVCVQQNNNYQLDNHTIQEEASFVSPENREFDPVQVPAFPLASQNNNYSYAATVRDISYSGQSRPIDTLSKSHMTDIFHLSPEPQYGAPSVAVATSINQKNIIINTTQSPAGIFQQMKPFGNHQGDYQYSTTIPVNSEIHSKEHEVLQKQYEQSKFNFGNIPETQGGYKF